MGMQISAALASGAPPACAKTPPGPRRPPPTAAKSPGGGHPPSPLERPETKCLAVAGAGGKGKCTNGRYERAGTMDGRPLYKQIGGDAVIYCSECWKITPKGDTRGWFYSAPSGAHGPEPPLGKWTTDGYDLGGADPPPTVAVVGPPLRAGDDEASGSPPFMALPVEPLPEPLPPPKKRSRRSTTTPAVDGERGESHRQRAPIAGAPVPLRRRSPETLAPVIPGAFSAAAPVASPGGDGEQAPVDLGSVSSSPSMSPPAARGLARDSTTDAPAAEAMAKPSLAPAAMASKNTLKDSPGAAAALKEKLNSLRRRAACRSDPPAVPAATVDAAAEVAAVPPTQTAGDGDAGAGAGIASAPKGASGDPPAASALSGPPGVWDGPPIPAGGNGAPAVPTPGAPPQPWPAGAASPWTYPPAGGFGARAPPTMKPGARLRGWVTHYYPHDQCGYLASHELGYGVELYFECYHSWARPLRHGDKVEFTPSRSPYGQPVAVNVSQVDGNAESSSGAGLPGLGWPSGDGNRSSRASSASPEPEPDGGASSPDSEGPEPLDSANCQ